MKKKDFDFLWDKNDLQFNIVFYNSLKIITNAKEIRFYKFHENYFLVRDVDTDICYVVYYFVPGKVFYLRVADLFYLDSPSNNIIALIDSAKTMNELWLKNNSEYKNSLAFLTPKKEVQ